jgi:hypothetical protein
MGIWSSLKSGIFSIIKDNAPAGILQTVKDILGHRAEESYPTSPTLPGGMESDWQSKIAATYRNISSPSPEIYAPQDNLVMGGWQYAHTDTPMDTNYQTIFAGVVRNNDTGEDELQYFSIGHDELLTEDDLDPVVDNLQAQYSDQTILDLTPVAGISVFNEQYVDL